MSMVAGQIMTYTKRLVEPFAMTPDMVAIEDIAHSLSVLPRFGGHSNIFMSVAEHSVMVMQRLSPENPMLRLTGLLHDAAEAYFLDMPKPIKVFLPDYAAAEKKCQPVVHVALGGIWPHPPEIKEADATQLEWEVAHVRDVNPMTREGWSPGHAESAFLTSYYLLIEKLDGVKSAIYAP